MTTPKNALLVLASGGMMLSSFYACASFIFASIDQKPIPLSEAALILFLATLITSIHSRGGWRRISVIGLHLSGWVFAILRFCHKYYGIESSFWAFHWIQEFLVQERAAAGWLTLVLILVGIWILWFLGIRLFSRPTDHTTISHRFDAGLGYLLVLLLIKLIIVTKGGSLPGPHSTLRPLLSFIILGLFSMGMVHHSRSSRAGGTTYLKGAGIAVTFTFIILMLGGGLFTLFLPEMQNLAETGADLLKTATRPLGPILVALIRLVLVRGCRDQAQFWKDATPGNQSGPAHEGGAVLELVTAGLIIAMAMAILLMSCFILFHLLNWFRTKSVEHRQKRGIWKLLLLFIHAAKRLFSILKDRILRGRDGLCAANRFYRDLLSWGRFSGLNHAVFETPREYAGRLGQRFPRIEKEFRLIVHLHDEAVYGCVSPDSLQVSRAKLALKRIRNPRFWLARIKSMMS